MSFLPENPALLLIDIQKGLDDLDYYGGKRNNQDAEKNASKILNEWRNRKLPVFHVRHSSQNSESPLHRSKAGFAIKDEVLPLPSEVVITKKVNSAFIGTGLAELLKGKKIETLVIVGLTTNHCVSSTVRMAANLGFNVFLIADATAAFNQKGMSGENFDAELIHQTTLASLNMEFATVTTTVSLLERLDSN